ncbi:MAG: cytochrome c biogenesis protein CcdA [Candidatus Schekmanbacteria bacterium]|nr:MAG: cytochrome c biogenesis protein CcdA [Candidatus Schekmanbacteria bacterium]
MESISYTTAFVAGLISFISPCVLPLVPAYISFISGVVVGGKGKDNEDGELKTTKVFFNALAFVCGFSFVFIILGAGATAVGSFLAQKLTIFSRIAGAIIIVFGLHMTGIFRIGILDVEKRYHFKSKKFGLIGSFLVGLAFAFGWTPCIGPVLGAILALASSQRTVYQGIILLSFYSAGLGIPFLLTALGVNQFLKFFGAVKPHMRKIEIGAGIFLIIIGILIMTNTFQKLIYPISWSIGI